MKQDFFFIRADSKYVKINFRDVILVEAKNVYVSIVTEKQAYLQLLTLRQLAKALPADQFCQVHKSYIVALDRILSFDFDSICLQNNRRIPIGDKFRKTLEQSVTIVVNDQRRKPSLPLVDFQTLVKPVASTAGY